jgi:hypothetical protein
MFAMPMGMIGIGGKVKVSESGGKWRIRILQALDT